MQSLTEQRCFNHAQREAVARCLSCANFFCRECITEHEDRVICAACLQKLARVPLLKRRGFFGLLPARQFLPRLLAAWIFFFFICESLPPFPTSFPQGPPWKSDSLEKE